MTPTVKPEISTTPKIEMPAGLRMLLKQFGVEPEKIQAAIYAVLDSGILEKVTSFSGEMKKLEEQRNRIEAKLDAIIKHLEIVP